MPYSASLYVLPTCTCMNRLLLYGFLPTLATQAMPASMLPDKIVLRSGKFSVNSKAEQVPSFLLSTPDENVISHEISAMQEKGALRIIIQRNEYKLHCILEDNGAGCTVKQNVRVLPKNSRNHRSGAAGQINKRLHLLPIFYNQDRMFSCTPLNNLLGSDKGTGMKRDPGRTNK